MNLTQADPKFISVTDIRRDIGKLKIILDQNEEAWVINNQKVFFVALPPEKYQDYMDKSTVSIDEAMEGMRKIRKTGGKHKGEPAASSVSKMRDERVKKWKR